MEFSIQLPTNPTERRRLQNRIAQRKFRQRRDQNQGISTNTDELASPLTIQRPALNPAGQPPVSSYDSSSLSATIPRDGFQLVGSGIEDIDFADLSGLDVYNDAGSSDEHLMRFLSGVTHHRPEVQATNTVVHPLPMMTPPGTGTTPSVRGGNNSTPSSLDNIDNTAVGNIVGTVRSSLTPWLDDQLNPAPHANAKPPHLGRLSPLHIAAQKGNDRILRVLLQHHGDPNEKDSDGRTPLMHASMFDHTTSVSTLLGHGARLGDVDNENRSCLHWAVLYRRHNVLELLLNHYSQLQSHSDWDINAYDDAGWTALHMAIDRGFEAGVALLLGHGANVHAQARKCPYANKPTPSPVS